MEISKRIDLFFKLNQKHQSAFFVFVAFLLVFGILCGSLTYALLTRTFRIETFSDRGDMINHLMAGILMGFGGVLALGCTIGQGVTGISTLSIGALLATASIILGSVLTTKVQYHMLEESFGKAVCLALAELRLLPHPDRVNRAP